MVNENIKEDDGRVLKERVPTNSSIKSKINFNWLMIILPILFITICTFVPMIKLFKLSLFDEHGFTLKYLKQVFTEQIYLTVIWRTIKTAFYITILCIILAYPVAYCLKKVKSKTIRNIIMACIMIPFWISLLVRSFSWMVILQDQGIVNTFLMNIGIIKKPLPLLYNTIGVLIGMTHILFPYMALSIYSTMESIDDQLTQVAQVLGAKPKKAFFQIFLPLSIPGVVLGSILVFVLSLGYYITPALLGGPKNLLISTLIQINISSTLNWPLASSLALVLFILTFAILGLFLLLVKKNPMMKGGM